MNQVDVLNYYNNGSNHTPAAAGTFNPQSSFFSQPSPGPQHYPQNSYASDPQARFLEQQRRQHDAGVNHGNMNGGNNGLMHAGFQQQRNASAGPFTSAPLSQSLSASAGTPGPGFQVGTHSASSSQHLSPSPSTPSLPPNQQRHPMAAPATPQATSAPHSLQSPAGSTKDSSTSQPQSPQTASSQAREKERVRLLLEINLELLQEVQNLQAQGKGGAQNAQAAQYMKAQGMPDKVASEQYLQTIMRLQANLGYLCGQSDMQAKPGTRTPHPPTFMAHPPNMPGLEVKYAELRKLFPGWSGRDGQASEQIHAMQAQAQVPNHSQAYSQQANGGAVMGVGTMANPAAGGSMGSMSL